jgi:hypothetical protein
MPYLRRHQTVELDSPQSAEAWASHFGVSYHELSAAVSAVGPAAADVEAYLRASQETMGTYLARMRGRLDEIETLVGQLTDERRKIIGFLEGFAQLQRSQRPTLNALAVAVSAGSDPNMIDAEYFKDVEGLLGFQTTVRQAIPTGSSAPVLEAVYRLLLDGQRRTVHEILSFLEVRGVPLKGSNQAGVLSTLLSRDPRFEANRRDGWGLTGTE